MLTSFAKKTVLITTGKILIVTGTMGLALLGYYVYKKQGKNTHTTNQAPVDLYLQLSVIANRCPIEIRNGLQEITLETLKNSISQARYFQCDTQLNIVEGSSKINWEQEEDIILSFVLTAPPDFVIKATTRNTLKFALDNATKSIRNIQLINAVTYLQDPAALVTSHGFIRA